MKTNNWKKLVLIIAVIIAFLLMIGFPYFLHKSKSCYPQLMIWDSYDLGSVLSYYGGVLTFIGTIIVSIIALIQTARDQEKADEINRLQLEIARRNLQIAEKSFQTVEPSAIPAPKFEIISWAMSGLIDEFTIKIKNVTSSIVSNLNIISCEILNPDDSVRVVASKMRNKHSSLSPSAESQCYFLFGSWLKSGTNRMIVHEKDLKFALKFSCEDEFGRVFYYSATHPIASTKDYPGGTWRTERIG